MNKKKTVTRWLLTLNETGTVDIVNREVSRFAPLNRILDEVGFYDLKFFEINDHKYFCTFDSSKKHTSNYMVHIGKREDGELLDMGEVDFINFPQMKRMLFDTKNNIKH